VTKITLTKIVLVANAHAGPSNNARPAFEMTAIALPARYAQPQLLYPYDDNNFYLGTPELGRVKRKRGSSSRDKPTAHPYDHYRKSVTQELVSGVRRR
jgi:hypothetical protein